MAPGDKSGQWLTSYNPEEIRRWKESAPFRAVLKKYISPRYDTLVIKPNSGLIEQVAFCVPRGQCQKTMTDTNMEIGSSLGTPNQAVFSYLRIHFEKYHSLEDAVTWKELTSIELITGYNVVSLRTTLGAMDPLIPMGGYKIDRMIKKGVIRFWPWYEAKLPDILVDSTDMFQVRVFYSKPFSPRNEMRIKVSLGPLFFGVR